MENKMLKRRNSEEAAARAELKRAKGEPVRGSKGAQTKGPKAKGAQGTDNAHKGSRTPKEGVPKGLNCPIGGAPKVRQGSIGGAPKGGALKVPKGSIGGTPKRGALKVPKDSIGGTPKRGALKVPKDSIGRAPKGGALKVPKRSIGGTPKGGALNVPKGSRGTPMGPKNATGDTPRAPRSSVVKEQDDILGDASKGPKCTLGKTRTTKDPTKARKKSAVLKEVTDVLEDKKPPVNRNIGKAANAKKAKVAAKSEIPAPTEGENKPKKGKPKRKEEPEKETDEIPSKVRKITKKKAGPAKVSSAEEESGSESSDEDWEEVAEINEPVLDVYGMPAVPETQSSIEPVEIEIETPELAKRRERKAKRKAEFEAYLRRMMNRFNKDVREDTHKVHLLCLLANGFHRNRVCNLPDLQAVALSIIPEQYIKQPTARVDLLFLTNLVKWFNGKFTLAPELPEDHREPLQSTLEKRFGILCAQDEPEMVHIFLIILRSMQLLCRLVLSLQPIPLKPPSAKEKKTARCKTSNKRSGSKESKGKGKKTVPKKSAKPDVEKEVETLSDDESGLEDSETKTEKLKSVEPKTEADQNDVNNNAEKLTCLVKDEGKAEIIDRSSMAKNQRRRTVASKVSYKEESGDDMSSDSDFLLSDSASSYENSEYYSSEKSSPGSIKVEVSRNTNEASSKLKTDCKRPEKLKPIIDKVPGDSSSKGTKKRSKILSSDEEAMDVVVSVRGMDQWLEVFMERDNRWVSIDCVHGTVNQPQQCYKAATKPMTYVVAIDNDGFVKDVTKRYDAVWMTSTRKHRVDTEWWEETIAPYRSPYTEREEKEDLEFHAKLLNKPLPTSITEYKNHPLYSLKRHLLKYEAIYPESAAILGYCKGEAVYSRECVRTLHSKDTWMKDARVVALGEVPYKMVKGQSNRARKARLADPENRDRDDLALYGLWQTEEYQPPVAVDGKVPRNEYGNVYLFKPCMLPIGCKHLHVPNLHRVARKLNIDCVPAITGFDFHCGFSHPVTDGYIVCQEFEDVLLDAWNIEQAELEKKENEKREKRVWGNWKLLIKGLLIRERLKRRYGAKDEASSSNLEGGAGFSSDEEEEEKSSSTETPAQDTTVSWPQNRQAEDQNKGKQMRKTKREKKAEETHLFPFEKM